jgi:transposase InsO family protein
MGIRDKPIAPRSPWQNGFAERLIGSIRRECLDHTIVLGEAHLRQLLTSCTSFYHGSERIALFRKTRRSIARSRGLGS